MGRVLDIRDRLMDNPEFRRGYERQSALARLGRLIKDARESRGLTQAAFAERLEISQSEISRLERGEGINGPTFERIVTFAHALGLQLFVGFAETGPSFSDERVDTRPRGRRLKSEQNSPQTAGTSAEDSEREIRMWSAF